MDLAGVAQANLFGRLLTACNGSVSPNIVYLDNIRSQAIIALAQRINQIMAGPVKLLSKAVAVRNKAAEVFAIDSEVKGLWHIWDSGGKWTNWNSLGGGNLCTDNVISIKDANDGPEIFVTDNNGVLWHIWSRGGNWTGWDSLGQPPGVKILRTSVHFQEGGGPEVFGIGSDTGLWHIWCSGGKWSGWKSLGGGNLNAHCDLTVKSASAGPEVFVTDNNGTLWHIWCSHGNWSTWASLGQPSGVKILRTSVSYIEGEAPEVFGIGSDTGLWHIWSRGGIWTGWSSLGGSNLCTSSNISINTADSGPEVFVTDNNGTLWHLWCSHGKWSGWESLEQPKGGVRVLSTSVRRAGIVDVFAVAGREAGGSLWHIWCDGGNWSKWVCMGAPT